MEIKFADNSDIDFLLENTHLIKDKIIAKLHSNELIIARKDNNQIGLLVIEMLWSHIPFIGYIWVSENVRGKGIGKTLLKFLENHLKHLGEKVLFSSSMETVIKAQEWHIKMGFSETGIIHNINENNIGEIFYRKELN